MEWPSLVGPRQQLVSGSGRVATIVGWRDWSWSWSHSRRGEFELRARAMRQLTGASSWPSWPSLGAVEVICKFWQRGATRQKIIICLLFCVSSLPLFCRLASITHRVQEPESVNIQTALDHRVAQYYLFKILPIFKPKRATSKARRRREPTRATTMPLAMTHFRTIYIWGAASSSGGSQRRRRQNPL